jgi:acyl dehydratase
MPLDLDAVGRSSGPHPVNWTATQAMTYALGVGASDDGDPGLAFTTENSTGIAQQVLPTFAVVVTPGTPPIAIGTFDRTMSVHGEQSLILHQPFPPHGTGHATSRIAGIHDKRSGALVVRETALTAADGSLLATLRTGQFIRGEGGFGGDPGPREAWELPSRAPDHVSRQATRSDQALLYRLSGDRNPLHSDPVVARRAGFAGPILHGLCTFGFIGRAVLAMVDFDPARFRSLKVRFAAPVMPGETLRTSFWIDGGTITFRTQVGDRTVLDAGTAIIA